MVQLIVHRKKDYRFPLSGGEKGKMQGILGENTIISCEKEICTSLLLVRRKYRFDLRTTPRTIVVAVCTHK